MSYLSSCWRGNFQTKTRVLVQFYPSSSVKTQVLVSWVLKATKFFCPKNLHVRPHTPASISAVFRRQIKLNYNVWSLPDYLVMVVFKSHTWIHYNSKLQKLCVGRFCLIAVQFFGVFFIYVKKPLNKADWSCVITQEKIHSDFKIGK